MSDDIAVRLAQEFENKILGWCGIAATEKGYLYALREDGAVFRYTPGDHVSSEHWYEIMPVAGSRRERVLEQQRYSVGRT